MRRSLRLPHRFRQPERGRHLAQPLALPVVVSRVLPPSVRSCMRLPGSASCRPRSARTWNSSCASTTPTSFAARVIQTVSRILGMRRVFPWPNAPASKAGSRNVSSTKNTAGRVGSSRFTSCLLQVSSRYRSRRGASTMRTRARATETSHWARISAARPTAAADLRDPPARPAQDDDVEGDGVGMGGLRTFIMEVPGRPGAKRNLGHVAGPRVTGAAGRSRWIG